MRQRTHLILLYCIIMSAIVVLAISYKVQQHVMTTKNVVRKCSIVVNALLSYRVGAGAFPRAINRDQGASPTYSWRILLTQYVDVSMPEFAGYNYSANWNSMANLRVATTVPPYYQLTEHTNSMLIMYYNPDDKQKGERQFINNMPVKFKDTLILVNCSHWLGPWTRPDDHCMQLDQSKVQKWLLKLVSVERNAVASKVIVFDEDGDVLYQSAN